MTVPCPWPVNPLCADWDSYSQDTQDAAINYATLVLWAATGRRFGLCPITVRPCGTAHGEGALWPYVSDGQTWVPYIDHTGTWRNASPCDGGNCEPDSQVWLPGPVDSVIEVIQDGVVVDPATYAVDNGRWLVRIDGQVWPRTVDLSTNDNRFEVTYVRGTPPPKALLEAAGVLACEFAKARGGQECRLPGRMSSIARQGVTISMLDTESLIGRNFTGIPEVDQVIFALNPHRLFSRPKVLSPDMMPPRVRRS